MSICKRTLTLYVEDAFSDTGMRETEFPAVMTARAEVIRHFLPPALKILLEPRPVFLPVCVVSGTPSWGCRDSIQQQVGTFLDVQRFIARYQRGRLEQDRAIADRFNVSEELARARALRAQGKK